MKTFFWSRKVKNLRWDPFPLVLLDTRKSSPKDFTHPLLMLWDPTGNSCRETISSESWYSKCIWDEVGIQQGRKMMRSKFTINIDGTMESLPHTNTWSCISIVFWDWQQLSHFGNICYISGCYYPVQHFSTRHGKDQQYITGLQLNLKTS